MNDLNEQQQRVYDRLISLINSCHTRGKRFKELLIENLNLLVSSLLIDSMQIKNKFDDLIKSLKK